MNALFVKEYKKLRTPTYARYTGSGKVYQFQVKAADALRSLKFHLKVKYLWDKYEDEEVVRMRIEPDDVCDYDNLVGDSFNPEANPDINPSLLKRQEKEYQEKINRDGVWGIIGEYKKSCEHCNRVTWEFGGSCWGFVGNEWKDAEDDIKAETLQAAGLWDEE